MVIPWKSTTRDSRCFVDQIHHDHGKHVCALTTAECLRGDHSRMANTESAQALRNAQRLMNKHCLNEADLQTDDSAVHDIGGVFGAKLTTLQKDEEVAVMVPWVRDVSFALQKRFGVASARSSMGRDLKVLFYGPRIGAEEWQGS